VADNVDHNIRTLDGEGTFHGMGIITASATQYHSLRVYFQVQQWLGLSDTSLQPQCWGWKLSSGKLFPVYMDKAPAPSELLQIVRCSCKSDCSSMKCTCKKNGLDCSPACKECKGASCSNTRIETRQDDNDRESSSSSSSSSLIHIPPLPLMLLLISII